MMAVATSVGKHFHERSLALLIIACVFSQTGFNDLSRNRFVLDGFIGTPRAER
jgi:hypothetical protein